MPITLSSRTHRRNALLCSTLMSLSGCAGRFGGERGDAPHPIESAMADEAIQRSIDTTYTRAEPAFSVTSTSQAGASLAVPALELAARAFSSLFEQRPPAIAIVVIDTTTAVRAFPRSARDGRRTITLLGSGLSGSTATSARTRVAFQKTLTVMAADAWIGEYANAWSNAIEREGATGPSAAQPDADEVHGLPDWIQVASIHLLANTNAPTQAARTLLLHGEDIVPLERLFDFSVPETSDADLDEFLSDLSIGAMNSGEFHAEVSPPRRETAMFVAQATSVLEYLRDIRGVRVGRDLFVPLLAGHDIHDVIARAPIGMSVASLQGDWLTWLLTRKTVAPVTSFDGAPQ
jgi:hypothetical protein